MSITSDVEYKPIRDFADRKRTIVKELSMFKRNGVYIRFGLRQFGFQNELLLWWDLMFFYGCEDIDCDIMACNTV